MADAQDLKSCGPLGPCGFDSRLGYLFASKREPLIEEYHQLGEHSRSIIMGSFLIRRRSRF